MRHCTWVRCSCSLWITFHVPRPTTQVYNVYSDSRHGQWMWSNGCQPDQPVLVNWRNVHWNHKVWCGRCMHKTKYSIQCWHTYNVHDITQFAQFYREIVVLHIFLTVVKLFRITIILRLVNFANEILRTDWMAMQCNVTQRRPIYLTSVIRFIYKLN